MLCLSLKLGQLFQLLLPRLFDYRFKFVVLVHTAAGVAAPAPAAAPTPLQLVSFQIYSQHFRLISNHVCACLTCSEAWKAAEILGKLLREREGCPILPCPALPGCCPTPATVVRSVASHCRRTDYPMATRRGLWDGMGCASFCAVASLPLCVKP